MVANGFFRNAIFRDPKKATMKDELKARDIDLLEPRAMLYGIDRRFVFIEFRGKLDRIKGNNMLGQMPLIKLNRKSSKEAAELVEATLDVCRKLEGSECMEELERKNSARHYTRLNKISTLQDIGFSILASLYVFLATPILIHEVGVNVYSVMGGIAGGVALLIASGYNRLKNNSKLHDLYRKAMGLEPLKYKDIGIPADWDMIGRN